MPSCLAHIKVKEKNALNYSQFCDTIEYVSSAMRGGPVYEYSTHEIRGRGCKTRIAE